MESEFKKLMNVRKNLNKIDNIIDDIIDNSENYENVEDVIVDYIAFGSFYSSKDLVTNVIDQLEKIRDNYEKYM